MTGGSVRYAALLRGVNVGGNKKIAMADLRLLLTGLGHGEVATHLQSGNAVFTADSKDTTAVAAQIEAALAAKLGLVSRVTLRTGAQLAAIVAASPLPEAEQDPSHYLVQFLFDPLTAADRSLIATVDPSDFGPENYRIGDGVLYFQYVPDIAHSVLGIAFTKKVAKKIEMTGRNWNTVRKLRDLTA
jgi:uncharacterized protein (DUF1697 family)